MLDRPPIFAGMQAVDIERVDRWLRRQPSARLGLAGPAQAYARGIRFGFTLAGLGLSGLVPLAGPWVDSTGRSWIWDGDRLEAIRTPPAVDDDAAPPENEDFQDMPLHAFVAFAEGLRDSAEACGWPAQ